ncbi:MAG: OmpP1/FadL family transporter [bacterium]
MNNTKTFINGLILTGLVVTSNQALSAGFQISEASVSGLGRAFAGAGVAGDDVSDMFYNPAGMFLADGRQFQAGLSIIDSQSEFAGSAVPFGGPNADGGTTGVVPNLYYTFPESGNLKYGISLTAPFGLKTEYDKNWAGRYQGLTSELTTIDINPALAYRVSNQVALGAGISIQFADAELSQARFLGLGVPDGKSTVEGDNWAFGFNLGAMFTPSNSTRFGIGFRSKIEQEVEGNLNVIGPTGATLVNAGALAEVDLPETVYLSAIHSPNSQWDILASARWTKWSRFEELRIVFDNGLPDSVTEENWDDTWTISLGANYHLSNQWTIRFGYAHDESPVPDEFRTVRIPDSDRDWFTLGASYSPSTSMTVDFGYAYLTGDDAPIFESTIIAGPPTAPAVVSNTLNGVYDGEAHIFGIQAQWTF